MNWPGNWSCAAAPETMPTWLFLKEGAINKEEVVASQIDEVLMPGAGVFTGTPPPA
jgi:hypothetical protein